ncbi:MAG: hypothetical protein U0527_17555 [Candidatus Eisenbacteria bacterium]
MHTTISRRAVLCSALVAALATFGGCSRDTTGPEPPSSPGAYDLNAANGGFTTSDEAPAFGDQDLAALGQEEAEVSDPLSDQLAAGGIGRTGYAVTLLWGRFDRNPKGDLGDDEGPNPIDWSGGMQLTDGSILVRRTIAFEHADYLLPRRDQVSVEWVSHTGKRFDGLRVMVVPSETNGGANDSLTIETPLFVHSFALTELANLEATFDVDQDGHQVRIQAVEIQGAGVPQGLVIGRWVQPAGSIEGHFQGRWVIPDGTTQGFVRGVFGRNAENRAVFYGKWIDPSGKFMGLINGTYQQSNAGAQGAFGTLEGRIQGGDEDAPTNLGRLRGAWSSGANGHGLFTGNWCVGCP